MGRVGKRVGNVEKVWMNEGEEEVGNSWEVMWTRWGRVGTKWRRARR
jgi:hypothetical protein